MIYVCSICKEEYDEEKEGVKFDDLPADWKCPLCGVPKSYFVKKEPVSAKKETEAPAPAAALNPGESAMDYIRAVADTGKYLPGAMGSQVPTGAEWRDILFKGGQLAVRPLEASDPVSARTTIGPGAKQPMVLETPVIISHMSFGSLSKEAKEAIAQGSAAAKTATSSGEGGIVPESIDNAYKYIFEYVPNKYGDSDENLRRADAVEIKIGQSAKPGMGGHLPAAKVTEEIAAARGRPAGADILSPSAFPDIKSREDLAAMVESLRRRSDGRPIGIKLAAGHIEADLDFALSAHPDFITLDGRPGGTGSAPSFIRDSTSVPTIYALARARKFLDNHGGENISLIITGGLRTGADFAKALAMGADAVAISTSALIAIGCRQARICDTGKCPFGIATQNPALRKLLDKEKAAQKLANFINASTEEIKSFARICGKGDVHMLGSGDIFTTNSDIAEHAGIAHAGDAEEI
jgi:glutamate synthase domain-containing protein 2/rubredoxin